MKYLQDYIEAAQTELFEELGVFFAFNGDQLAEGIEKNKHLKPEGDKWISCGMGMIMPKSKRDELDKRLDELLQAGIAKDLAENGREGVLDRELGNYEIGLAFDGYNDPNFRAGISGYGFTEIEIIEAYRKHMDNNEY